MGETPANPSAVWSFSQNETVGPQSNVLFKLWLDPCWIQYRTGPCNTISSIVSHPFIHFYRYLNNRLYKEYNLHFFKNLSALCAV